MKKIFASIMALMLSCGIVYAENTATVNNKEATVDISFDCAGADYALIMIQHRESGKYIWAGQAAVSDDSLSLTVSFDSNADGEYYDVFVTDNNKKAYSASFYYVTEEVRIDRLGDINGLVASTDDDRDEKMQDIIEDYSFLFQYNMEQYTYLENKLAVANAMLGEEYLAFDDFSEKLTRVVEELYTLQKDNEAATKLGAASADEICAILEEYEDVFGISLDDIYYKYSNTVNAYIQDATIKNAEDAKTAFNTAMAVPYVNEAERVNLLEVLYENDAYLGIYDMIVALEGDVQIAALKAIESGSFGSIDEILAAVDDAVDSFDDSITDYSDAEAAKGTLTVGKDLLDRRVELIQDMVTQEDLAGDKVFTDLDNVPWAEEAILSLYEKGIVSGRSKNEFAPDENITRAELVAMLVRAYELSGMSEEEFADVSDTDWYFNAVMTARACDITSGDEENNFMPQAFVTREDMAVLIFRAMGVEAVEDYEAFSDDADISDYAKNAVYYMKESKILSGMEDGSFMPEMTATRAQCAKALYGALALR